MIKNLYFALLVCSVLLSGCALFRPSGVPRSKSAESFVLEGKRYLRSKRYEEALTAFEAARKLPRNRTTTAAIYLSGIAALKMDYPEIAEKRFQELFVNYPKSKYLPEARYHDAMLKVQGSDPARQTRGLEELYTLSEIEGPSSLGADTRTLLRKALFELVDSAVVKGFMRSHPQDQAGAWAVEASSYRIIQKGEWRQARSEYEYWLDQGGQVSPFLEQIFPEDSLIVPEKIEPDIQRISLFLPLVLPLPDLAFPSELNAQSLVGLQFYEGFRLALDEWSSLEGEKVYLDVVDTRRDTFTIQQQFRHLDDLRPDLIIGGVYNEETEMLGRWAQKNERVQLIPISSSASLVAERPYSFLMHPGAETHGSAMGDFASRILKLDTVAVFTDSSESTQQLVDAFRQTFEGAGGYVEEYFVEIDYESGLQSFQNVIEPVDVKGVYIPILNNQELANLVLTQLNFFQKEVVVMGSPHFRSRYTSIDRDLMEQYGLYFTTSTFVDKESEAFQNFRSAYIEAYSTVPDDLAVQGYDICRYALNLLQNYNYRGGYTFDTFIRAFPPVEGMHIDFFMEGRQSNQRVNIGQYTTEGTMLVDR